MLEKGIDENGKLIPDPEPMALPIGYKEAPSMIDIVRNMVRGEALRQAAEAAGAETFEESEDFDIGDDVDELYSGYENDLDVPLSEIMEAGREAIRQRQEAEQLSGEGQTPSDPLPRGERREGDGAQEDGAGAGSGATEPRSS